MKKQCPICKRTYNSRCFKYNKVKKELLCRICNNRIGQNIFYEEEIKGAKIKRKKTRINFLKRDERDFLFETKDEEEAKKRIIEINDLVKNINKNKNKVVENKSGKSNIQKKLEEGLKGK